MKAFALIPFALGVGPLASACYPQHVCGAQTQQEAEALIESPGDCRELHINGWSDPEMRVELDEPELHVRVYGLSLERIEVHRARTLSIAGCDVATIGAYGGPRLSVSNTTVGSIDVDLQDATAPEARVVSLYGLHGFETMTARPGSLPAIGLMIDLGDWSTFTVPTDPVFATAELVLGAGGASLEQLQAFGLAHPGITFEKVEDELLTPYLAWLDANGYTGTVRRRVGDEYPTVYDGPVDGGG